MYTTILVIIVVILIFAKKIYTVIYFNRTFNEYQKVKKLSDILKPKEKIVISMNLYDKLSKKNNLIPKGLMMVFTSLGTHIEKK